MGRELSAFNDFCLADRIQFCLCIVFAISLECSDYQKAFASSLVSSILAWMS